MNDSRASDRKAGVLLVNLGTPDAPTPRAVRRFLAEFLSDPRVIDYPKWLWYPILYGAILNIRPRKSAHAYASIWTNDGSPLLLQSMGLTKALQQSLGAFTPVELGMTYGAPSIASALRKLREQNVQRIVAIPLYPQYSGTTTGSVFDRVTAELRTWPALPQLHFVNRYCRDADYLDALAGSVNEHWLTHAPAHLFFSFHGIPQRYVNNGDPYYDDCKATAEGVAARLSLSKSDWSIAFQSRVGREQWLTPYTDQLLVEYAKKGPKEVAVMCPAFATDCLETLEEIAIRNREDFLVAGGERFEYIPCLNAQASHVNVFARIVDEILSASGQSPAASGP